MVDNEQLVQDMKQVYDKLRAEFDSNLNGIQSKKKGSLKRAMALGKLLTEMGVRISRTAKEHEEITKREAATLTLKEMAETLEAAKAKIPNELYDAWKLWLRIAEKHTDEISFYYNLAQLKKNMEQDLTPPYLTQWAGITLLGTMPRIYGISYGEFVRQTQQKIQETQIGSLLAEDVTVRS